MKPWYYWYRHETERGYRNWEELKLGQQLHLPSEDRRSRGLREEDYQEEENHSRRHQVKSWC